MVGGRALNSEGDTIDLLGRSIFSPLHNYNFTLLYVAEAKREVGWICPNIRLLQVVIGRVSCWG